MKANSKNTELQLQLDVLVACHTVTYKIAWQLKITQLQLLPALQDGNAIIPFRLHDKAKQVSIQLVKLLPHPIHPFSEY